MKAKKVTHLNEYPKEEAPKSIFSEDYIMLMIPSPLYKQLVGEALKRNQTVAQAVEKAFSLYLGGTNV